VAGSEPPVHVRWMTRGDLTSVLAIEHLSYREPWTADELTRTCARRNQIGMVATKYDRIVGFVIYRIEATRLRVLNLAVGPRDRDQGVGRELHETLVRKLHAGRPQISLRVRETSLGTQRWLRRLNYRAVGVDRGWYRDTGEDAYQFVYLVSTEDLVRKASTITCTVDYGTDARGLFP
jgi:[ribosomal protein S18]-alanine N-acetyltransferase